MKYYSDVTKKMYDTVDALNIAEKLETERQRAAEMAARAREEEARKKSENRKTDAQKVEAARNHLIEARKAYNKALKDFCEKYGAYHTSYTSNDVDNDEDIVPDIFRGFLNNLFP